MSKKAERLKKLGEIKASFGSGCIPKAQHFKDLLDWANEGINETFSEGMIMMFSGDTAPEGWYLCNAEEHGRNPRIPDLSDKFIIGASKLGEKPATYGEKLQPVSGSGPGLKPISVSLGTLNVVDQKSSMGLTSLTSKQIPSHEHLLDLPFRGFVFKDLPTRTASAPARKQAFVRRDYTNNEFDKAAGNMLWRNVVVHADLDNVDTDLIKKYGDTSVSGGIVFTEGAVLHEHRDAEGHGHTLKIDSLTVEKEIDITTPYYAMAFIIRLNY